MYVCMYICTYVHVCIFTKHIHSYYQIIDNSYLFIKYSSKMLHVVLYDFPKIQPHAILLTKNYKIFYLKKIRITIVPNISHKNYMRNNLMIMCQITLSSR